MIRDFFHYYYKTNKTTRTIIVPLDEYEVYINAKARMMFIDGELRIVDKDKFYRITKDNLIVEMQFDGLVFKEDYYKEHYGIEYDPLEKAYKEVKDGLLFK